jgi:hypothetical protein
MKEKIHEQINNELRQASRYDTTITIISIVLTFILFGISMAFAEQSFTSIYSPLPPSPTFKFVAWATAAMFVSLIATLVINLYSILALMNNKKRKARLVENLAKLYQEEGTSSYSADVVTLGYKAKGNLFIVILSALAAVGIIIPLILFIDKIVEKLPS